MGWAEGRALQRRQWEEHDITGALRTSGRAEQIGARASTWRTTGSQESGVAGSDLHIARIALAAGQGSRWEGVRERRPGQTQTVGRWQRSWASGLSPVSTGESTLLELGSVPGSRFQNPRANLRLLKWAWAQDSEGVKDHTKEMTQRSQAV